MSLIKFDRRKPYRYVRYGRMSDDDQNPRSPDQQFATIEETKRRNNLTWVQVRDFRDDGITGRLVRRRPGFWEMLLAIFSGALQVDLILVDTFERFGRAEELQSLRQQLEREYGVLVLTADTNFSDPTSPSGRAMGLFENFRATEDNRIKSHNVRRGKHDAVRLGHWPGGRPPFGLMLEPVNRLVGERQELDHHKLVHDPRRGWIITLAAQKSYDAGWGDARVTEFLNSHPDIPDEFKPFNASTVGRRLRNKLYMGVLEYSKTQKAIIDDRYIHLARDPEDIIVVQNFCEPLIEPTLFRELERMRELRNRHPKKADDDETCEKLIKPVAPGLSLNYLLSGLVVCGRCGRGMVACPSPVYRTKSGEERRYTSYYCPGTVGGLCSNTTRIKEDWLRGIVVGLIRSRLFGID